MNTIKNLVLAIATLFSVACTGAQTHTRDQTQELIRLRAELDSCRRTGNCSPGTGTQTATAQSPATAPTMAQRTPNMGRQALGPMPSPGVMAVSGPGYMTTPNMVYRGGNANEGVAIGVAVVDSSNAVERGMIRFKMGVMAWTLAQREADAISIEIDGRPIQISYYGERITQAFGEYRLADGMIKTRPIFAAPMFQSWQEGLRIRLDDTGEHSAKICFHFLQKGRGTYQIMNCKVMTVSVLNGSPNYFIENGTVTRS